MGLAEYPERIYRSLVTQKINKIGAYAARFLIQGQVKIVTIDDYFPCKEDNKLAFSVTRDNEMWLSIIEKAWTKINNCCYMKTWLGIPSEALNSLSEAPTIYENHKKYLKYNRIYDVWDKIKEGFKKRWVICANTEEAKNTEKMGLVENHAYGIISCYECDIDLVNNYKDFLVKFHKKYSYCDGEKIKLLKIKNPWGCKEWKGDFGNNSNLWSEKLKNEVNFDKIKIDGIFYMTFEDFTYFYPWTFFCKIQDNFFYRYGKYHQNKDFSTVKYTERKRGKKMRNTNNSLNTEESFTVESDTEMNLYSFSTFFLEVQTKTHCYLCLHQPQKRFMTNYHKSREIDIFSDYKTPIGQMIVVKYDQITHNYKFIGGDFINWEKINLDLKLDPGEYHIYCRSFWKYPNIKCKLVLSTYSDFPLEIYQMKKYNKNNLAYYNLYRDKNFPMDSHWLIQTLKQIAIKSRKKDHFSENEKSSYFSYDIFDNSIGFGMFYYENNSEKGTINAVIQFDNISGVRVLGVTPNNEGEYILKIPPKSVYVLPLEILDLPWDSSISWSHLKWFEYEVDYMVRNFLDSSLCEKQEYENGNIVYSKITHQRGFIIHIENTARNDYNCSLNFEELKNLGVEDNNFKKNRMIFRITRKSAYYFQIKWMRKNFDCKLKIEKKFEIIY